MPNAGGQYVYLREAFSPLWGFLYGWTLFLVIQSGTIAAVAVGFARYFGALWPWIHEDRYLLAPGVQGEHEIGLVVFSTFDRDALLQHRACSHEIVEEECRQTQHG